MRASSIALALGAATAVTIACGAPAAVAEAPRTAGVADAPLFPDALTDDASVGKAIREHYTKYEYRITMRDGVKLYTDAYVPKDASRSYPIVMMRTPYGIDPYGVDNSPTDKAPRVLRRFAPSNAMVRDGFVFVHQDVRGAYQSEGTFVDVRPHATKKGEIDESTDAYDTIEWLVKNVPNNNGRVGAWGISYPGFYAAQTAVDAHPALKAVSPQAPVTDWFMGDDDHHNGAFFLAESFDFYSVFGKPRPAPTTKRTFERPERGDVYDFYLAQGPVANLDPKFLQGSVPMWTDLVEHPNLDAFWKARNPRPLYRNVKPAVLTVGGFFDKEDCFGALETYRAFEKQSPGADNALVMGPWQHGDWARTEGDHVGDVAFGQKTARYYQDQIELPFFRKHLKGQGRGVTAEATVFETGTNVWQRYDAWPPRGARKATLFLQPNGKLASTAPKGAPGGEGAFDAYPSDPAHPVPYRAKAGPRIDPDYTSDDQRFATRRPDVLTYELGPLDADVTFTGPLEVKLWVSTTGTDADFVVKVIDGYPLDHADPDPNPSGVHLGGYQQLVRAEVMRARFRESFETPKPFVPGEPTLVRFTLPDVAHSFRSGHRILVQVQSSWFPLVDRNPQTFVPNIAKAKEADFVTATHRVYHASDRASSIEVTLTRGSL